MYIFLLFSFIITTSFNHRCFVFINYIKEHSELQKCLNSDTIFYIKDLRTSRKFKVDLENIKYFYEEFDQSYKKINLFNLLQFYIELKNYYRNHQSLEVKTKNFDFINKELNFLIDSDCSTSYRNYDFNKFYKLNDLIIED